VSERPELYPWLDRTNHRRLPAGYEGDVLVWDIDKTYLDTAFSSLRGLLSIPLELAVDKRALPGTVPLLRALRRGPGDKPSLVPLYFVSGSPRQLRSVIEQKMTLDGVGFDGITFKDQVGLLLARRPRAIVHQVGYKLLALLLYRADVGKSASWLLFGDDVEADAAVFLLFGEVCGGLAGKALEDRLKRAGVRTEELRAVLRASEGLEVSRDPVERIFIHLASGRDPADAPSSKVTQTRSFVQTALMLAHMGRVNPRDLRSIVDDVRRQRVPERHIQRDVADAAKRLGVPAELCALVRER
jgi:hypothetical protein